MRTPRNKALREPGRNASPLSRAADPRVPNEAGFITRGQLNDGLTTFLGTVEARFRAAGYVTRGALNAALATISGFATPADVAAASAAATAADSALEARIRSIGYVTRGALNAALATIAGFASIADVAAEAAARDAAIALAEARLRAAGWVTRGGMVAYVYVTVAGWLAAYLPLSGGALTGPVTLAADPVVPLGAVTKQYADALVIASGSPTYLAHAACGGL